MYVLGGSCNRLFESRLSTCKVSRRSACNCQVAAYENQDKDTTPKNDRGFDEMQRRIQSTLDDSYEIVRMLQSGYPDRYAG